MVRKEAREDEIRVRVAQDKPQEATREREEMYEPVFSLSDFVEKRGHIVALISPPG